MSSLGVTPNQPNAVLAAVNTGIVGGGGAVADVHAVSAAQAAAMNQQLPVISPQYAGMVVQPAGGAGATANAVAGAAGAGAAPTGLAPGNVAGGGAVAAGGQAPADPLQAALASLVQALTALQGVIQALQGQSGSPGGGTVEGGGAAQGACSCPCCVGLDPDAAGGGPGQGPPTTGAPPAEAAAADAAAGAAATGATGAPADGGVRDRIVQIAQEELARGVTEDAGKDTDSGGHIVKYRGAVTGGGEDPNAAEPWCADFASWVLKQAGAPIGDGGVGLDYTVDILDWAKREGRFSNRDTAPQPGDLVLFKYDRNDSPVNHVAVVTKVEDGKVHTIGGNESDSVSDGSHPLGDGEVVGYVSATG